MHLNLIQNKLLYIIFNNRDIWEIYESPWGIYIELKSSIFLHKNKNLFIFLSFMIPYSYISPSISAESIS